MCRLNPIEEILHDIVASSVFHDVAVLHVFGGLVGIHPSKATGRGDADVQDLFQWTVAKFARSILPAFAATI